MKSRSIYLSILIITIFNAYVLSQEIQTVSSEDTTYRYNAALRTLDSLLKSEVYGKSVLDTAFFSSYGNAESVTLEQLIYFALKNSPQLKAMFGISEAEKFRAEESSYLPDPMFEVEADDIMSDFSQVGMINFYISQMFMWPGKLSAMRQMGIYNSDMMRNQAVTMGVDILNMVKMNYYDLYLNYRRLDINKENQLILQTLVSAAEARYSVGLGMQGDVFKSQIELTKLKNDEFVLQQEQKNLLNNLSALTKLNINNDTKIRYNYNDISYALDKSSFDLDRIDSLKLVDAAILNRPEMNVLRNKLLMNRTSLDLSELNRYPDFEVKLGYKILPLEMTNAFQVMLGITLPFAPWVSGKYDNAVKRNRLEISASLFELDTMKVRIRNEVLNVISDIRKTRGTMNYYNDVMIPQSENMLRSMQYSYENKMANFIDLLDAYRMLQESREMLLQMTTMYLKMLVDLERSTGMNIKKIKTNN